jgi:hypothetical protein
MIAAAVMAAAGLAGCGASAERGVEETTVRQEDCIETRCVAAYHKGGTPYWTDQRHRFCPSSVLFEAWGTEPEGAWRGSFNKGQFSKTGLDGAFEKSLPAGLMNAALAELVYYSFTAGAMFMPPGVTATESVPIEGQRYEAFQVGTSGGPGRTLTLYKNADTGLVELVRITGTKGVDWLARSYNPRYNDRFKRMIARKIDVFDVRQGISAKQLLVQFDYIDVK